MVKSKAKAANTKKEGWFKKEHLYVIIFIVLGMFFLSLIGYNGLGITTAATIRPFEVLGNWFGTPINGQPLWAYLASFAIIFAIFFTAFRRFFFFKEDEQKGAAFIASLALSLFPILLTDIVSIMSTIGAAMGYFLIIIILGALVLVIYFAAHKNVVQGYTEGVLNPAVARQQSRNALIEARNAQPQTNPRQQIQYPHRGGRFNPGNWFRGNPQQPQGRQPARRQQGGQGQARQQNQQQAIRRRWALYMQQAMQSLNSLNNDLANRQNWNSFLQYLARISQIRQDLPNVRIGNLGYLLRNGQRAMQGMMRDPNNNANVNTARVFVNDAGTVLGLISNQI